MRADQAAKKLVDDYKFDTVLDIGCGDGEASDFFVENGKTVTSIDFKTDYGINGDYRSTFFTDQFDAIWISHVLEHQINVNDFLQKVWVDLKDDGILAVTVPPAKKEIVGGHVTTWNAGLLLYNLILAGFDCSDAAVKKYGYNISVICRKSKFSSIIYDRNLKFHWGDITSLSNLFPPSLKAADGFNGDIEEINWEKKLS